MELSGQAQCGATQLHAAADGRATREVQIRADAYFFDIDGTLVVTRDLVHWNARHEAMLQVYGVDTTIEGVPYHGKTDIMILRMALSRCAISETTFYEKLPLALSLICSEVSANAGGILAQVCPAIRELLTDLQGRQKFLGVASGNLESVGWNKLSAAGLRDFFEAGSFGDQREQRIDIFDHAVSLARSTLGSAASICFLGDTPDDIRAARAVNAQVVAVSTGTFPLVELAALNPDACCSSCAEIIGALG